MGATMATMIGITTGTETMIGAMTDIDDGIEDGIVIAMKKIVIYEDKSF